MFFEIFKWRIKAAYRCLQGKPTICGLDVYGMSITRKINDKQIIYVSNCRFGMGGFFINKEGEFLNILS